MYTSGYDIYTYLYLCLLYYILYYVVAGVTNIYRFATMSQTLDKISDVDIDDHGIFKYILINVQDEVNKANKTIVRGYARANWHGEYMRYLYS